MREEEEMDKTIVADLDKIVQEDKAEDYYIDSMQDHYKQIKEDTDLILECVRFVDPLLKE